MCLIAQSVQPHLTADFEGGRPCHFAKVVVFWNLVLAAQEDGMDGGSAAF